MNMDVKKMSKGQMDKQGGIKHQLGGFLSHVVIKSKESLNYVNLCKLLM